MNYRELYENYYKVILPYSLEIHHIDYNHNNNNVENLVALPRDLHKRLHIAYYNYFKYVDKFNISDIYLHDGRACNHTLFMEYLYEYMKVIEECVPYMNDRNFGRLINHDE